MPKEIQSVFDGIGGFFANPTVQFGLRAIAIYFVVLWLAGAFWAFRDMQLRTENPILPYAAASLIIVFTPLFFPFAIIVYRIVRPQERIGEVYERTLAEEALLAEVEAIHSCPTCGRRVHEEWLICPLCRTRLKRVCPNCEKLVGLDWSLCAWCGRDFERREIVAALEPRPEIGEPLVPLEREVRGQAQLGGIAATGVTATGVAAAATMPGPGPSVNGTRPTGARGAAQRTAAAESTSGLRTASARSIGPRSMSNRTSTTGPTPGPLPEP